MTAPAVKEGRSRTLRISLLALLGVLTVGAIVAAAFAAFRGGAAAADKQVDGDRAYGYLVELCKIGPRIPGTEGMAKQQELLTKYFEGLGAKVSLQKFRHKNFPRVEFANMIIQWHPRAEERVLLCAHYDTRPYPDRDPRNPRGTFIGASDGASGVAVLMELGRAMPDLTANYGVDFVLFDAEDYVWRVDADLDDYCLGSEYFAQQYARDKKREYRYVWGVLLDMVGDADLQIYKEKNSLRTEKGRQLVKELWAAADRLGVREFYSTARHELTDDHLPLISIAKIPTCDIIDFDYRYWHTEGDVPERCSGDSLAKVGRVVLEWLRTVK